MGSVSVRGNLRIKNPREPVTEWKGGQRGEGEKASKGELDVHWGPYRCRLKKEGPERGEFSEGPHRAHLGRGRGGVVL